MADISIGNNPKYFVNTNFLSNKIPRGSPYVNPAVILRNLRGILRGGVKKRKEVERFEEEFAKYFDSNNGIAFPYARSALYFILKSFAFPEGSEVITTPITVTGIINAVLLNNLKPVFVDLSHNTGNINIEKFEEAISKRTRAVLVTHLNGIPAEIDLILNIAKKHNLIVLEDASQSIGAKYKEKFVGTFGDAGFFSISSLKPISTLYGGMVLTSNKKLASQLRSYMDSFSERSIFSLIFPSLRELTFYFLSCPRVFPAFTFYAIRLLNSFFPNLVDIAQYFDFNIKKIRRDKSLPNEYLFFFTEYQARIGCEALKFFKSNTEKRANLAYELYFRLKEAQIPGLIHIPLNSNCTFWRFPLWTKKRSHIRNYLLSKGIDTALTGLDCCSMLEIFKEYNAITPEAFEFMDNMLFLPIHSNMNIQQVGHIARSLISYCTDPH